MNRGNRDSVARSRGAVTGAGVLCGLVLFAGAGATHAQTRVKLEVDKQLLAVGEVLQVTVSINLEGRSDYDQFLAPPASGFEVLGNTLASQNIEVINWRVRRSEVRVLQMRATSPGRQTLGPAAIRVGGRTVKSGTVAVQVQAGATPPGATAPPPQQPRSAVRVPRDSANVFIAATITPTRVYVGQQIKAEWRLYTRSDVLNYSPTGQPSADHFWSEDLESPRRLSFEREVIDNRVLYSAVVLRKAFFPQQDGKLVLGGLGARVRTLEDFGGKERKSEPVQVEVLPLPEDGRPPGFPPDNVGQFEIAALVDRDLVQAGEAVQLRVVVRGRGNLRQVRPAPLPPIAGLKVYDPKVTERIERDDGISGEKVLEYLLLPTDGREIAIPSISLDYFDPLPGAYKRVKTEPITVRVTGKLPQGAAGTAGEGKNNVLGRDIRPPRSQMALADREPFRPFGPWQLALVVLPLLLFGGAIAVDGVRTRLRRETARSLSRATARRVRGHLKRAAQLSTAPDAASGFYGELTSAINEQLSERLGCRVEGLTRSELRLALSRRGFDEAVCSAVVDELDACDFGRFARLAASAGERQPALERARQLIQTLARGGRRSEA